MNLDKQINEKLEAWDPKQGEFHYNGLAVLTPERKNIVVSAAGTDGLRALYFIYRRQVHEEEFGTETHSDDCKCKFCKFPTIEDIIADGYEIVALYRCEVLDDE